MNQVKLFICLVFFVSLMAFPLDVQANEISLGQDLFIKHCSGCHINGENIIRRNKTLKLKALKRNGLDNQNAIAEIARKGIGSMDGYEGVLGEGGDQLVASWVWQQAQNAWIHG